MQELGGKKNPCKNSPFENYATVDVEGLHFSSLCPFLLFSHLDFSFLSHSFYQYLRGVLFKKTVWA